MIKIQKANFVSKTNTHQNSCYGCGFPDHMIKDCPNAKKKNERTILKSKKIGKRAMVATQSANDRCESETEDEDIANLYLMARDNNIESEESKELILEYLLTFTKEYLA